MKPLEHLKQLMIEERKRTHPNTPYYIPNVWQTAKPEAKELKRIVAFLNLSGHYGQIMTNTGKRIDNTKIVKDVLGNYKQIGSVEYRPSTIRNGTADIMATINGQTVWIELKRIYKNGRDRQSQAQIDFQRDMEAIGAKYVIVHSFEDFYEWFNR